MSPRNDSASFGHYRREVEAMLAVGHPLGAVEQMLADASLDGDERSALWLLAWALDDEREAAKPAEAGLADVVQLDAEARP